MQHVFWSSMRRFFRRAPKSQPRPHSAAAFRRNRRSVGFEWLEPRQMLSGISPIASPGSVGIGAPVIVPVLDADATPLTFAASSSNSGLTATLLNTSHVLKMQVHGMTKAGASFSGEMDFLLLDDVAPKNIAHVTTLANATPSTFGVGTHFYDGLTFHRVISGAIQGGDPLGSGIGGSGPNGEPTSSPVADEFNADLRYSTGGLLAIANAGPNTNDCQFFITNGTQRAWDYQYTVFGVLISGDQYRQDIENVAIPSGTDRPSTPPVIDSVTVVPDTHDALVMLKAAAEASGNATVTITANDGTSSPSSQFFDVAVGADNGQVIGNPWPAPAAPMSVAFVPPSGQTSTTVTVLNNTAGKTLSFLVSGVTSGNLVTILADGNPIGNAIASGTTVTVATDGAKELFVGSHNFTAVQTAPKQAASLNLSPIGRSTRTVLADVPSPQSPAAHLTIDPSTVATVVDLPQSVGLGAPVIFAVTTTDPSVTHAQVSVALNDSVTGQPTAALTATVLNTSHVLKMHVTGVTKTGTPFSGEMDFLLLDDYAPLNIQHFTTLADSTASSKYPSDPTKHFFDGLTIHRVIPSFVFQGGDPLGSGVGGSGPNGYRTATPVSDEFNPDIRFTSNGLLAIANSGPDTNDCQFFVTDGQQRELDYGYPILGKMISGFDIQQDVQNVQTVDDGNGNITKPSPTVTIDSVSVVVDTSDALIMLKGSSVTTNPVSVAVTVKGYSASPQNVNVITDTVSPYERPAYIVSYESLANPLGQTFNMPMNTPITAPITVQNVEGASLSFATDTSDRTNMPATIDSGGNVTITPKNNIVGVQGIEVQVSFNGTWASSTPDTQVYAVFIRPAAPTIQFSSAITNGGTTTLDNSSAVNAISFTVGNLLSTQATTVNVYADPTVLNPLGTLIGTAQAPAGNSSITVTTDPVYGRLSAGSHTFVATQSIQYAATTLVNLVVPAGTLSSDPSSSALTVTIPLQITNRTVPSVNQPVAGQPWWFQVLTNAAAGTMMSFNIMPPGGISDMAIDPNGLIAWTNPAPVGPTSFTVTLYNSIFTPVDQVTYAVTVQSIWPPTVSSVTPNLTTITAANVGSGTFTVTVLFAQPMKTTVNPTITFTPNADTTLTFANGSWNSAGTQYTATYDVASVASSVANVGIGVTGAQDANGVVQTAYTGDNKFSININMVVATAIGSEIIGDGQPGFWSSSNTTWSTSSKGLDGGSLVSSTANGSKLSQAAWWFSMPAGLYDLSVTYTAGYNLTSQLGLDLYDGVGNWIGQYQVNEQNAANDFTSQGVGWKRLGSVKLTNNVFHVSTWNSSSNGAICVDAIQLRSVPIVNDGDPTGIQSAGTFSTTGTWLTAFQGAYGGSRTSLGVVGTGSSLATWTMPVSPGYYEIDATWQASALLSANATYMVYDGNTLLGSRSVNQRTAPSGVSDEGVAWKSLGSFTVSGSQLKVTLANSASDGQVCADAVRILPAYQPSPVVNNGNPGFWSNAAWSTQNTGLYGDSLVSNSGNGSMSSMAAWWFPCRPGTYEVDVTWQPGSNLSTKAPFDVYNALTYVSEPMVNEQNAPVGTTDQGVAWQSLGTFTMTSNVLHISTWNSPTDGSICVDGFRIVPVSG